MGRTLWKSQNAGESRYDPSFPIILIGDTMTSFSRGMDVLQLVLSMLSEALGIPIFLVWATSDASLGVYTVYTKNNEWKDQVATAISSIGFECMSWKHREFLIPPFSTIRTYQAKSEETGFYSSNILFNWGNIENGVWVLSDEKLKADQTDCRIAARTDIVRAHELLIALRNIGISNGTEAAMTFYHSSIRTPEIEDLLQRRVEFSLIVMVVHQADCHPFEPALPIEVPSVTPIGKRFNELLKTHPMGPGWFARYWTKTPREIRDCISAIAPEIRGSLLN